MENIETVTKKIDKTLYRVKCVYKGETELAKALEELIVQKVLRELENGDE